jgi:2-polyprenyl-3-methyl-5-hydroxy-6-metoxy-1,4-benzoquinol methylase
MRDLSRFHGDSEERKYAYDFDYRMHDFIMRSFAPHRRGGRALEMGCYKGVFTERLAALYQDLTVVEGAADLIAEARERVGAAAQFVHSYFETFEPAAPFDAIYLIHTLEHIERSGEVLRRVRGWLAEGGRLFVAVPNAHAASRQIAVAMGLITHDAAVTPGEAEHGHYRTYSIDTLLRDLREAGLVPVDFGGVVFKPLANFQIDRALAAGIIDDRYLEGCYQLGKRFPDMCASLFAVCEPG